MKHSLIIFLILTLSVALHAGVEDSIIEAWEDRVDFSAEITRLDISPFDTLAEDGVLALRRPDMLYKTGAEFILFTAGTLFTFTEGSDAGIKSPLEDFVYADIAVLLDNLRGDFEIGYIPGEDGAIVLGKNGTGNIVEFRAELDGQYLPVKIIWSDIFGNSTELIFGETSLGNPGDIFSPPEEFEFILQ